MLWSRSLVMVGPHPAAITTSAAHAAPRIGISAIDEIVMIFSACECLRE
jgi:hypothetical protein